LEKLGDWHKGNAEKHKISLDDSRRRRQGVEGFFMRALGLFNDDLNYKKMSDRTVSLITHQGEGRVETVAARDDLFQEDVRLVAKEGKLYYLPAELKTENIGHDFS
jgi:hypothetical protein